MWQFRIACVLAIMLAGIILPGPINAQSTALPNAEKRVKTAEAELMAAKTALDVAKLAAKIAKDNGALSPDAMQLSLPRLKQAPKIDGVIGAEWDTAIIVPSTTGANGAQMSARPASVYYLGWDPEFIYVAQRMPLRDGELPRRLNRKPQHQAVDPWETETEFYIDRNGNGSHGLPAKYQFMGNAVGNRWDVEFQYSIGQNNYDWNGDWQYAQRVTPDGKFWETEMAIPRKSIYAKDPFKDGERVKIGFAASLQDPWQWSGFYGFSVAATLCDATPVIRIFHPERGLLGKRMSFDAEVVNTTTQPLHADLVARLWDPGARDNKIVLEKHMPISLAPGERYSKSIDEDAAAAVDRKS